MSAAKQAADLPVTGAPPVVEEPAKPKAGDGEVVVTSPTGTVSVVEKHLVDGLKVQGYRVS